MDVIFGVSPAYFISHHDGNFGPKEIAGHVKTLAALGFRSIQLEAYSPSRLREWAEPRGLYDELDSHDVTATVFVAHYLGTALTGGSPFEPNSVLDQLGDLLDLIGDLPDLEFVVLPLPPWENGSLRGVSEAFVHLSHLAADLCRARNLKLAFEVMPNALCGDYLGLHDLLGDREDIGVCLDTGHVHASGLPVPVVIRRWSGRIFAVHLCDNNGTVNESNAPGKGTIAWGPVLDTLEAAGYHGPWDLEIIGTRESIADEYKNAMMHLRHHAVAHI
jgi:sugar phosphate isomerase/epimerase